MEEVCSTHGAASQPEAYRLKSKRQTTSSPKKNKSNLEIADDEMKVKEQTERGEKRTKRRKPSDSNKKVRKEDYVETKSASASRHSSPTPDSEMRQDQSGSPLTDDVFDGASCSQESGEILSMSSLLKSVLDQKKRLLLESDEIQQFLVEQVIKQEEWRSMNSYDQNS